MVSHRKPPRVLQSVWLSAHTHELSRELVGAGEPLFGEETPMGRRRLQG